MIARLQHYCGVDDPAQPHRVALGAALGIFVAFTPTVGFQMMIVVALASLFRANKLVGVPLVWISNPLTIPPMFYVAYSVGRVILGWPRLDGLWWGKLSEPPQGWWAATAFYWHGAAQIAVPLWLGSVLLGGFAAAVTYGVVFSFLRNWQQNATYREVRQPSRDS